MPQTIRACDAFGADQVLDCSGHPSAGRQGIAYLRDGGTFVQMSQFTDTGAIETNWHRFCAKDPNVLGRRAFTANDLPLGVDMPDRARNSYPGRVMQTPLPVTADGIRDAIAQAMVMRTVRSTIVPNEELI